MFTYILFAFVGAGAKEGFVWIGLHASLLFSAIYIDQTSDAPSLSSETIPILIVCLCARNRVCLPHGLHGAGS